MTWQTTCSHLPTAAAPTRTHMTNGTPITNNPSSSQQNSQRGQDCRNCGGAHLTGSCPSAWCHTCNPCKKFESADARKAHFISVHGFNSNRGGGRGVGRGGGGRSGGGRGDSGRGGRGGDPGTITEVTQSTTKPALANQSEDGDKQPKKMNCQVTIIQRDQSNGRCEALDFDYGY